MTDVKALKDQLAKQKVVNGLLTSQVEKQNETIEKLSAKLAELP